MAVVCQQVVPLACDDAAVPVIEGAGWLAFGSLGFPAIGTTFLFPWFGSTTNPSTIANAGEINILRPGVLSRFAVRHANPGGASNVITYTIIRGGVATAIALPLNVTGTLFTDYVSTLVVAQDDRIALQCVQGGAVVAVSPRPTFQMIFTPTS